MNCYYYIEGSLTVNSASYKKLFLAERKSTKIFSLRFIKHINSIIT